MPSTTKIDIYLATPYTNSDPHVEGWRHDRVNEAAAFLLIGGAKSIYSPISHTHPIDLGIGRIDPKFREACRSHEFWVDTFDKPFLLNSSILAVLMLPGWGQSAGIKREIEIAQANNIPVKYLAPIFNGSYQALTGVTWRNEP